MRKWEIFGEHYFIALLGVIAEQPRAEVKGFLFAEPDKLFERARVYLFDNAPLFAKQNFCAVEPRGSRLAVRNGNGFCPHLGFGSASVSLGALVSRGNGLRETRLRFLYYCPRLFLGVGNYSFDNCLFVHRLK